MLLDIQFKYYFTRQMYFIILYSDVDSRFTDKPIE